MNTEPTINTEPTNTATSLHAPRDLGAYTRLVLGRARQATTSGPGRWVTASSTGLTLLIAAGLLITASGPVDDFGDGESSFEAFWTVLPQISVVMALIGLVVGAQIAPRGMFRRVETRPSVALGALVVISVGAAAVVAVLTVALVAGLFITGSSPVAADVLWPATLSAVGWALISAPFAMAGALALGVLAGRVGDAVGLLVATAVAFVILAATTESGFLLVSPPDVTIQWVFIEPVDAVALLAVPLSIGLWVVLPTLVAIRRRRAHQAFETA